MNEQQLIDAYTREALHQYRAQPVDQDNTPTPYDQENAVDWALFFHVVVRVVAIAALLYIAFCMFTYVRLFGASAVALSGQFSLAVFFTYAVLSGYDDAETLLSCVGMFLLVGMF